MKTNSDIIAEAINRLKVIKELSPLVIKLRLFKAREANGSSSLPPLKNCNELLGAEPCYSYIQKYICCLIDSRSEGIGVKELYEKLRPVMSAKLFDCFISDIRTKTGYCCKGQWLYKDCPRVLDYLNAQPESIAKKVFMKRIAGMSSSDIGRYFSLPASKINDLIADMLLSLTSEGQHYYEDRYALLFESCFVSSEFLHEAFNEDKSTYNYLSLRYKPGTVGLKAAARDTRFSPDIRKKIQQYLDKEKKSRKSL